MILTHADSLEQGAYQTASSVESFACDFMPQLSTDS